MSIEVVKISRKQKIDVNIVPAVWEQYIIY